MGGFHEKILNRKRGEEETETSNDKDETDIIPVEDILEDASKNLKFFGTENTRGYPSCLDLRFPDGNCKAIPYSYIVEINFHTEKGIEIMTATKKVTISGRNLQLLYKYLLSFRIKYIQANIGNDISEESAVFVKEIKIGDLD
jgi:hypothetical protein